VTNTLPFNFGGLPKEYSNYRESKIAILPVGFDRTSSWQKGSRKGPKAIINASRFMELYDMETKTEVFKRGIHTGKRIRARNSEILNQRVFDRVSEYLGDKKFVVVLGGEHSVSLGAIQAHHHLYKKLSVLHLDAHADARTSYEGNKYSHACVMARVRERIKNIVSVGIRSMDISETHIFKDTVVLNAEQIAQTEKWIDQAILGLTDWVYITIDVDVFDSGIMPSTGTPEPGGLQWYQVIQLLRRLTSKKRVVGFDVVELCPTKNKAPDYLAAKMIYKLLSFIFKS
jgi:agmatinase